MAMQIDLGSEGLDRGHNPGSKLCARDSLEVFEEGIDSRLAKISQKPALVAEEDAQHFGDGKYHLTVGDIQQELLPHPLSPFLPPLGMAGWAKSSGAA